jgi:putative DeoR family transcriptional regulator (stage III sporulation protein D)
MFKVFYSRPENLANYIIDNNATIRQTAKQFNFSKSLVHNDVSNRLKNINLDLYLATKRVLEKNFKERHIRGGMATKQKYLLLHNSFKIN